jgi:hypothetical protein
MNDEKIFEKEIKAWSLFFFIRNNHTSFRGYASISSEHARLPFWSFEISNPYQLLFYSVLGLHTEFQYFY